MTNLCFSNSTVIRDSSPLPTTTLLLFRFKTPTLAAAAAKGFIDQDAALYLDEWGSEYLMVGTLWLALRSKESTRTAWQNRSI